MPSTREFRVLVASDGSLSATAAVTTAAHWPWPPSTRMYGIVAEQLPVDGRAQLRTEHARVAETIRISVEQALRRRWPEARVWRHAGEATAMILRQARRARADLIVVGWRGHGAMRRLLMGSVSRAVVRQAERSVLVVRRASRQLRRMVIGYDGSANADRALRFVAGMAPQGASVTVVMAVQLAHAPSQSLASAAAAGSMAAAVKTENAKRQREARRILDRAARPLLEADLKVDYVVSDKAPLDALLAAATGKAADALVVGATGATGLRGLLLGSVAQGALDRSRAPVLIVR